MDTSLMTQPSEELEPSKLVAHWRRAAGLSQTELGDRLPVGVDMVRRIEGGSAKPSAETARALDEVLDTNGAIFRAYFSRPDDDAVARLQGKLEELSLDVQSLAATVAQLAGQVRRLSERPGPPPPESQ